MRLYPPVTEEEASKWLTAQAADTFGADWAEQLAPEIAAMATALATLSAIQLDDAVEPVFP